MKRVFILLITVSFLALGCGGGSAGTGTVGGSDAERVLAGEVKTSDGEPLGGATLTIVQTGESTESAADGTFRLPSISQSDHLDVLIEKGSISSQVAVEFVDNSSGEANLSISVDPTSGTGTVHGVDVRVKVVGDCDRYFENHRTIRQANPVPQGKECTLQISLHASRGGLPNRTFALQYRKCAESGSWVDILGGETGSNGVARVKFSYRDDEKHCVYRVVVPLNDNELQPLEFDIDTETFQRQP